MSGTYSIAEARDRLSQVVREAENRGPVELKRRGRTVAYVLSAGDFARLQAGRKPLASVVAKVRERFRVEELGIDPDEVLSGARDASAGRDFQW